MVASRMEWATVCIVAVFQLLELYGMGQIPSLNSSLFLKGKL